MLPLIALLTICAPRISLPVSGGGSASPLTTKGDLYTHSTVDDRLPTAADGLCLQTLATTSTGLTWGSCSGGASAPTNASYVTSTAEAALSNEQNIGLLTTGLMLNTVSAGTGTISAYAGSSCTNQFARSTNASGALTCASVASADLSITATSCTNQFVSAVSTTGVGTCTTSTLAGAQHANQGTATTLLHGNAAGNPTWSGVAIADHSATGTPDSTTFLRGDNTWAAPPGGGGGISYAEASAATLAGF